MLDAMLLSASTSRGFVHRLLWYAPLSKHTVKEYQDCALPESDGILHPGESSHLERICSLDRDQASVDLGRRI